MTKQNNNGKPNIPTITKITQEIEKKSADAEYIYRGEPAHYDKISSSLYRDYLDIDTKGFDIEKIQEEIISKAKQETNTDKNREQILSELQHYGGKTNLIDFTTDYRIALFFACDGKTSEDGRVILQKKKPLQSNKQITTPQNPAHLVIAQKTVFISLPKGYIDATQEEIVNIPKERKEEILNYLRKYHGISAKTIYNDLHGFVRNQKIHKSAYTEFFKGNTCIYRGDSASTEKEIEYDKAIEHYYEAIKLSPNMLLAYNNRGIAHCKKGNYDKAIYDFHKSSEYQTAGDFYKIMGDFYCGIAYGRKSHDQVASCYWRAGNGLSHFFRTNKREPIEKELKQLKVVENDLRTELKSAKKLKNKPLADIIQKAITYIQNEFADLPADLNS